MVIGIVTVTATVTVTVNIMVVFKVTVTVTVIITARSESSKPTRIKTLKQAGALPSSQSHDVTRANIHVSGLQTCMLSAQICLF